MKKKKAIYFQIILFLTTLIMICMVSIHADAATVKKISTAKEFLAISKDLSGDYILTKDIDFSGVTMMGMIGSSDKPFTGTLDGSGHVLKNITFNKNCDSAKDDTGVWAAHYVSLFAKNKGTIKNIGVSNFNKNFKTKKNHTLSMSGLVHENEGTLKSCFSTGNIKGENLAGLVLKNYGTIDSCYNNATITASGTDFGGAAGICSSNSGIIKNSYNKGKIISYLTGISSGASGISSGNSGTITNCYNQGTISSHRDAAGISLFSNGVISKCYNTGNIASTGGKYGIGFVAGIVAHGTYQGFRFTVTQCYNKGSISVKGQKGDAAGIVGWADYGTISQCYNIGSVYGQGAAGGIVELAKATTVNDCFNAGTIKVGYPTSQIGGIVGYAVSYANYYLFNDALFRSVKINRCYDVGSVMILDKYFGGIHGYNDKYSCKVSNSYFRSDIKGGIVLKGMTSATLSSMKSKGIYKGFNFSKIWTISGSGSYRYPTLRNVKMVSGAQIAPITKLVSKKPATNNNSGQAKLNQSFSGTNTYTRTWGANSFTLNTKLVKGNGKLTYKSNNTSVASVTSKGVVTTYSSGTATITVSAAATSKYKAASYKVKVTVKTPGVTKVTSTGSNIPRQLKVNYSKSSGADGYQVQYALNPKFTGAVTSTTTKTTFLASVAKSGNVSWYSHVRPFIKVNNKYYYGSWSTSVKVHVHNSTKITVKKSYKTISGTNHYKKHTTTSTETIACICGKHVSLTKTYQENHNFIVGYCRECGTIQNKNYVVATFKSSVTNKKENFAYPYTDAYFTKSTKTYNNALAKLSLGGASAAYYNDEPLKFLKNCDFHNVVAYYSNGIIYGKKGSAPTEKDNDHVRVIFGHKVVSGVDIYAIMVKGTSGDYEWVSNFNIGHGDIHEGFLKPTKEVLALFNKYVQNNKKTSKTKIWITGHSRGAVVANITAHYLNEAFGESNVYAYTFASPRGVKKNTIDQTKDKNIFNIINPGDFVPEVAPASWGFARYGRDIVLDYGKVQSVNSKFKSLTKQSYQGFNKTNRDILSKAFAAFGKSQDLYDISFPGSLNTSIWINAKDYCQNGMAKALMSDNNLRIAGAAKMIADAVNDANAKICTGLLIADGVATEQFRHAHAQEGYAVWLEIGA